MSAPSPLEQLGRAQAVANALRVAARDAWEMGRLRDAAKLFSRFEVAETRAVEVELRIKYPGAAARVPASELFRSGRPLL